MEPAPALHVGAGSTRAACAMAQTQRPRAAQAPPSWHRCSQHQPSAHPANCCAVQPLPLLRPCRWAQPCGWGATARSARGCCRCTRRVALRPAGIFRCLHGGQRWHTVAHGCIGGIDVSHWNFFGTIAMSSTKCLNLYSTESAHANF